MATWHCSIHNIDFSYDNMPDGQVADCPCCMLDELKTLREEYRKVVKQRDVLVEAIGVVNTVRSVSCNQKM